MYKMSQNLFADGLGYEGKVTLTLKSNNRVLSSKTYKNKGTAKLFKFLGYCLIGAYEEASSYLPNKILLLHNTSKGATSTAVEQRSAWQPLSQTPTIISDGSDAQVKVTYSFEVPKAALYSSGTTVGNFNQVALYSVDANDITDFSAFYYLTDTSGELESIDLQDWSATTVLLIEWELILSNKNVETNAAKGENT